MGDELSNKTVLVHDLSGSYTHIASAFVGRMGRVLYFSQWESGFSNVIDYTPGEGLDGIERVFDPADHYADIDFAVFPDVGLGGLQEYLRASGVPVWGSARDGNLERDRLALKTALQSRKMDVAEYEVIRGLTALREYLEEAEPCWIKVSYFRGLTETYHHEKWFMTEEKLNEWAVKAGPYREEIDFLVEQPIEGEAVEVGIDTHAVDMGLPRLMLWGYERKDSGFLGCVGVPPARLLETSRRFMAAIPGYRGPLSNEIRTTEDKDYLVDLTARFPCPPSEIQVVGMKNFAEVAYWGARGVLVEPEYAFPCWAQLVLCSDVLEDHAIGLEIGMPEWTALHGHCRFDGKDYVISPSKIPEFGGAVGGGDTFEDAIKLALEAAEAVKGSQVRFDAGAFDEIMETIKRGESLGLPWAR